jgi:hypothetical protein
VELYGEKTEDEKSRDTVPLRKQQVAINVLVLSDFLLFSLFDNSQCTYIINFISTSVFVY